MSLGLVYTSKPNQTTQNFWQSFLMQDQNMLFRFAAMTPGYINAVLKSKLSIEDKFFLLFGYAPAKSKTLGTIFEDIGSWFGNTFSSQNMQNMENWLRQGSVTAQNIANALNYYTNAPTSQQIAQQQQQLQTLQSQILGTGTGILDNYGSVIAIGAVGLLAVVLLTKK